APEKPVPVMWNAHLLHALVSPEGETGAGTTAGDGDSVPDAAANVDHQPVRCGLPWLTSTPVPSSKSERTSRLAGAQERPPVPAVVMPPVPAPPVPTPPVPTITPPVPKRPPVPAPPVPKVPPPPARPPVPMPPAPSVPPAPDPPAPPPAPPVP